MVVLRGVDRGTDPRTDSKRTKEKGTCVCVALRAMRTIGERRTRYESTKHAKKPTHTQTLTDRRESARETESEVRMVKMSRARG